MNWLIFKLVVVIVSMLSMTFPLYQYVSFLFNNFGQAIDTTRIKKLRETVIYLVLTCVVTGYLLSMAIGIIMEVRKGV